MAIIYSYPQVKPKASDLLIGTVTYDGTETFPTEGNPTRTFSVQNIVDLAASYELSTTQSGTNATLRLTNDLGSLSVVNLVKGNGITLSSNGSNAITITNSGVVSVNPVDTNYIDTSASVSSGVLTISSSLSATGTPTSLSYLRGDNKWSTPVNSILAASSTFINVGPTTTSNGNVIITAALSATGTPNSSNFLRGDNQWAVPAGGGTVTSINSGTGISVDNTDPDNPIVNNTGVLSNIAGTGISISGATGNSTITNTAPDQTVVITGSGGATVTGTYPNFNISTTDNEGVETIVAGTAISVDSTDPANPIVTNTAPDQNVVITGSGNTTVTGTYPTFDISSDSGVTQIVAGNDISISPVGGTGIVTINSTSQGGVTSLIAGTNITLDPATGLGDVTITSTDTTYSAGTDISITNEVITNTAPDQIVAITGTGGAVVSGTYPNFNVDVVAGEQGVMAKDSFVGNGVETNYQLSVTPTSATYTEVFISGVYQEASTYTLSADTITLSTAPDSGDTIEIVTFNLGSAGGGGGGGAVDSIIAGTGISVSGPTGNVTVTNSQPDQTVVLNNGTGITTSGTYPNFTITNSLPDQTVALTGAGGTTITGTYPNFTISSTAGGGGVDSVVGGAAITIDNTDPLNPVINNNSPDQIVAISGSGASTVTGTYPNFTVSSPVVNTDDFITNANDTYPSVSKVTDIISLTQSEYDAITPDENAVYIIVG